MKMFAAVLALLALVSTPAVAQGNPGPDEFAQALIGNSLIGKTSKNRDYAVS